MLLIGLFQWWYVRGWRLYLLKLRDRLKNAADFFSLSLLIKNLFAPFRQISAGASMTGDLSSRFQAFIDRLISRIVGTFARLFLLIVGTIVIIFQTIIGAIIAILWPLAPALIVVCFILTIMKVSF